MHNNGIAGIKPTSVMRAAHRPHCWLRGMTDLWQQLGPMVRRVEDIALITPIIMVRLSGCELHAGAVGRSAKVELKKLKAAFAPTPVRIPTKTDGYCATAAKWLKSHHQCKEVYPKR
jgi:amidase